MVKKEQTIMLLLYYERGRSLKQFCEDEDFIPVNDRYSVRYPE